MVTFDKRLSGGYKKIDTPIQNSCEVVFTLKMSKHLIIYYSTVWLIKQYKLI